LIKAQGWDWIASGGFGKVVPWTNLRLIDTDSFGNSYAYIDSYKDTLGIANSNGNSFCCITTPKSVLPPNLPPNWNRKYLVKFNRNGKLIWYKDLFNIDNFGLRGIINEKFNNNILYIYNFLSSYDTIQFAGKTIVNHSPSRKYILFSYDKDGNELDMVELFFASDIRLDLKGIQISDGTFYGNMLIDYPGGMDTTSISFKNKHLIVKRFQQLIFSIDLKSGNSNWTNLYFPDGYFPYNFTARNFLCQNNSNIITGLAVTDSNYRGVYHYPKTIKFNNKGKITSMQSFVGNEPKLNWFNTIDKLNDNRFSYLGVINSQQMTYQSKIFQRTNTLKEGECFVLIVDSNLNYIWHWVFNTHENYKRCSSFANDTAGNIYLLLNHFNSKKYPKLILPDGKLFSSNSTSPNASESTILMFDKNGKYIRNFEFPNYEHGYGENIKSDKLGNIYIDLFTSYDINPKNIFIKFGEDTIFSQSGTFLAKLNTHLLKINQETLWCATDSLSAKYDTGAFKRLAWFFNDTLRQIGEKCRPNLTKTGKYKVRLTAYEWDSCSSTIGDSFMYYQPPKIKVTRPQIGCVYAPFWFTDSSYFDNYPNIQLQVKIDFGDGTDTTCFRYLSDLKGFKFFHIYNDSGTYDITYTIMHQGCSNSFTTKVKILPAPRPGIVCLPAEGCTPLKIDFQRKYTDLIDSVSWQISKHTMVFKGQPQNFTINNAGKFWLSQKIYGPTGCVTRDSVLLTVRQGMLANTKPYLIQATLLNNFNVEVIWHKVPHAAQYELYLPNGTSKRLIDTAFNQLFNTEINTPLTYKIRALDSCENPSMESNIGRTIFCTAKEIPGASKNDLPASVVSFTSYLDWREGVKNYTIETKFSTETLWQPLVLINDTSFADLQFTKANEFIKCYRINATSNSGVTSISNELCLPYQPVIFIPSAITPNEDGLNDDFDFYTYGIENIHTEIYNRWGMKIWEGGKNEKWKPAINNMVGVYVYIINGKSASTGTPLQFKGTITVL
jgi:hypothetical protein